MNTIEREFRGFEKIAAKKSEDINKVLSVIIFSVEAKLNAFSSTPNPKRRGPKMEMSFSKHCGDALKNDPNLHIMDYDSGYMSHNQESNSDSSMENAVIESNPLSFLSQSIFISEDALLERPDINIKNLNISAEIDKEDHEEMHRLFNLNDDEIVNPSVQSVETQFSGFVSGSGDDSDMSIEIAPVETVFYSSNSGERTNDSANSTLNDTVEEDTSKNLDIEDMEISNSSIKLETTIVKDLKGNTPVKILESSKAEPVLSRTKAEPQCDKNIEFSSQNIVFDKLPTKIILNDITNQNCAVSSHPRTTYKTYNTENKENISYKSKTPKKLLKNNVDPKYSPDLFDEEPVVIAKEVVVPSDFIAEEKYIIKKDARLLKRVQNGLSGVPPPSSVTVINLSLGDMLAKLENNKQYFWSNDFVKEESALNTSDNSFSEGSKSLLVTTSSYVEKDFPKIMEERFHGLHFNRSKISEELELLMAKYAQRCVGAETQSTCTVFECPGSTSSPSKKRMQKNRFGTAKSPGRRLSHLARRRITFSSANLQAGPSMAGMRARQIMIDAKRFDLTSRRKSPMKSPRKTPKKTPSKSPKIKTRTPSSSAKKKLAMRFRILSGEFGKTMPSTSSENLVLSSKRALFQSPTKTTKSMFLPSTSGMATFQKDTKKGPTKRALFASPHKNSPKKRTPLKNSPFKKSPFKNSPSGKKRKRIESNDEKNNENPCKMARSFSMDIRPSESELCKTIVRSRSELNVTSRTQMADLSDIHKKKLQWAVYEALRHHGVTPTHAQFKVFASILARVTRRFFCAARTEGGSTSDRMLRISRHHVFAVIKGKSVDEIVQDHLRTRAKNQRLQGYVAPEEFNRLQQQQGGSNVSQERNATDQKVERIRKVINFGDDVRWNGNP